MTPSRLRAFKVVLLLLGMAAVGVLFSKGADQPSDPWLLPAAEAARTPVAGFGQTGFRIEGPNADAAALRCALLAETPEQHSRGLMGRRDLAGYDGMVFDFKAEYSGQFYMKDTPLPLSIAWFDGTGRFVSATDMAPCLNRPECPLYSAVRPYRYALEVAQGGLPALGIGPGSRLVLVPACT
jgi:uncharacterized membrane protein (UPF0127 family)